MRSPNLATASPRYVRDAARPERFDRAVRDLRDGAARWRLALALARLDIRNRYRGSIIGPFWLTVSTAVMVVGIGLLYSSLFKLPLAEYLPFLAVSLLIWNTLNQIVGDAGGSLTGAEGIIRQVPLPYTVHVLRFVIRNAIVAAHSLPLIAVVFLACGVVPGWGAVLAFPGLVLLFVNAFAGGLLLGMVCARFRDVGQIVASVMQLAFFLTPVLWKPSLLGDKQVWLPLNPFYVLMEVIRGPLIEGGASPLIWAAALFYTVCAVAFAFAFFVRFRGRIAFWV
jgi:lipopolysaccharide transport system permease protein